MELPSPFLSEFLDSVELPSYLFLQKIECAVSGLVIPPPHHVCPSVAPLYRGPYLVLKRWDKFFCLQLGYLSDIVSIKDSSLLFLAAPSKLFLRLYVDALLFVLQHLFSAP